MTAKIDLAPDHLAMVQAILAQHLPENATVWVVGSRATWTAKEFSDLDLAVEGAQALPLATLATLKEALSEAPLPFKVDVIDWHSITSEFRDVLEAERVMLAEAGEKRGEKVTGIGGLSWAETTLSHLIEVRHGYAFKGEYFNDNGEGDVLLTPGNFAVGGGFQLNKLKFYSGPKVPDYELSPGDLIVTMTDLSKAADTLGYPALIPEDGRTYLHNERLGLVTLISEETSLEFVYWYMRSPKYRNEILADYTGSTVKHTAPKTILSCPISLPSKVEQRAISEMLTALENKIELNRQMNETLEVMARALFQDWFVDFGPTRRKQAGETDPVKVLCNAFPDPAKATELAALFPDTLGDDGLPRGWKRVPVSQFAQLRGGKQLNKDHFFDTGDVPVFGGAGHMGHTDEYNAEGFIISVGRVGAYCGNFVYCNGKSWINNNASWFDLYDETLSEWLFLSLKNLDMNKIKKGAAQPFVSNRDIAAQSIIKADKRLIRATQNVITPLFRIKEKKEVENQTLAKMRDLLLPKLMSGEIRLKDAA